MNSTSLTETAPAIARAFGLIPDAAEREPTSSELEQARLYLEQTRSYAVGATKGLSDAQWKFKPSPDRWSILEIVEHIIAVQELVLGPIWQQLAEAPAAPADRDYKQVDEIVLYQFPNRLNKFPSPEQPTADASPLSHLIVC